MDNEKNLRTVGARRGQVTEVEKIETPPETEEEVIKEAEKILEGMEEE